MSDHQAAIAAAMIVMGELHGARIDAEVETWPELTDQQRTDLALIVAGDHAP